jgi:hypothetical protein
MVVQPLVLHILASFANLTHLPQNLFRLVEPSLFLPNAEPLILVWQF